MKFYTKQIFYVIHLIFGLNYFALASHVKHNKIRDNYATSVTTLVDLLDTETELIGIFENYVKDLREQANYLEKGIENMRQLNTKLQLNPEEQVSNYLKAFPLMRRMHAVWPKWIDAIMKPRKNEHLEHLERTMKKLPNDEDMQEGVLGVERIQSVYGFEASDMASGIINGTQFEEKLSAFDSLSIGFELFRKEKFDKAIEWLKVALNTPKEQGDKHDFEEFDFNKTLEHYVLAQLKSETQNNFKDLIAIDLGNNLKDLETKWRTEPLKTAGEVPHFLRDSQYNATEKAELKKKKKQKKARETELLLKCCRGECNNSTNSSLLYCRYNSTFSAFHKLAPFKFEELSLDPYIVQFYDVISESEMDYLRISHKDELVSARVYSEKSNKTCLKTDVRSAKAVIGDRRHKGVQRFEKLVTQITGFTIKEDAERLKVINYGLGGHYIPHVDHFYFNNPNFVLKTLEKDGDRLATFILYLSDVELGGATVFPYHGISVAPIKGSALLFYNYNSRLEPVPTVHASCPVIIGSKWIASQWISSHDQMFIKPCRDA